MTQLDDYRNLLADGTAKIAATFLQDRTCGLLALLHAGDTLPLAGDPTVAASTARPGWNLALRLCLDQPDDQSGDLSADCATLDSWAEGFLAGCDQLALASQVLAQCEAGDLQLQQHASGAFIVWSSSRRLSTEQRERLDFEWWSAQEIRKTAPRLATLLVEGADMCADLGQKSVPRAVADGDVLSNSSVEHYYRKLAQTYVARFAAQHSYPAGAIIAGATIGQFTAVVTVLIGWLLRECDRLESGCDLTPGPFDERALIAALAYALDEAPATIGRILQPLILDRENAAYHSALPTRGAPPLIRLDETRVIWSARGLLGEPLIFLARELRRRHAQEYHNSAHLREGVFRQDLYRLFGDKRFVLSAGRVELKRNGAARTDLDALIFDRKTGALGVFELKAQDPFARSVDERQRQRDNFFYANRQVSAILEWVQRHGADDLLTRFDERAAKRFHVQQVYVFVLGRYLAHFSNGPEPDRRAAWGSWPQILQLVGHGAFNPDSRNPLSALFSRLRDAKPPSPPDDSGSQSIEIGDLRVRIYPSFAAMRLGEDCTW